MGNNIYKKLDKEYEYKRNKVLDEANFRKQQLLQGYPKYAELVEKLNSVALEHTMNIVKNQGVARQVAQENIELKIKAVNDEINQYLRSIGYNREYLEPNFECDKCQDKGKILKDNIAIRCNCYVQRLLNEEYGEYNLLKLKEENFNTFDTCYYSSSVDKAKYGVDKSPKENIETIKQIALSFCDNFDNVNQKSLLFIGNTGTGKTFMSSAIAQKIMQKGYTVLYQTSPMLLDAILDYKFSQDKTLEVKEQYIKVYDVDLLIIDDLGTETMSNVKFTELLNIINTRILKNKKTIISTNLMLPELATQYDERVMSRLIGNYVICKFFGEDIRLKKKKME